MSKYQRFIFVSGPSVLKLYQIRQTGGPLSRYHCLAAYPKPLGSLMEGKTRIIWGSSACHLSQPLSSPNFCVYMHTKKQDSPMETLSFSLYQHSRVGLEWIGLKLGWTLRWFMLLLNATLFQQKCLFASESKCIRVLVRLCICAAPVLSRRKLAD